MCTYLKPYSGTYYFRRTVPGDIRHLFPTASGKPRTEWRWSLRVKDREAGKRLLPPYVAKTNAMIDRARQAIRDAAGEVPARQASTVRYPSAVADEMERADLPLRAAPVRGWRGGSTTSNSGCNWRQLWQPTVAKGETVRTSGGIRSAAAVNYGRAPADRIPAVTSILAADTRVRSCCKK